MNILVNKSIIDFRLMLRMSKYLKYFGIDSSARNTTLSLKALHTGTMQQKIEILPPISSKPLTEQ